MRILPGVLFGLCCLFASKAGWAFQGPEPLTLSSVRELLDNPKLVSSGGRDFDMIRAIPRRLPEPRSAQPDRFLVQGGLHGNEQATIEFVNWLAHRYARGESLLNLFPADEVEIDFLPVANPDGLAAKDRYNTHGVNLNRNFGVLWGISRENPGTSTFSEPETQAIQSLFVERGYLAAVDVHGFIEWVVSPSKPEELRMLGGGKENPSLAREKAHRQWYGHLEQELAMMPGYTLKTAASLGDGGAFEDWAFWTQGTFAFCLEMESFQRFSSGSNLGVMELAPHGDKASLDLFRRYEAFIFRMFQHARALKPQVPSVASRRFRSSKDL